MKSMLPGVSTCGSMSVVMPVTVYSCIFI
jgi:hypothetical protein